MVKEHNCVSPFPWVGKYMIHLYVSALPDQKDSGMAP